MMPYSEYCEWPATQRMRPTRLARRVKFSSITGSAKPPAHGDKPNPACATGCRAPYLIWLTISSMLKNFHEMFGLSVYQM